MIANVALDYTEWAPPLTEAAVKLDIDSYRMQFCRTPSKIIMWVHQWDYLAKRYKKPRPMYVIEKVEFDGVGLRTRARPVESAEGGYLWGVKVEVRDPESHRG